MTSMDVQPTSHAEPECSRLTLDADAPLMAAGLSSAGTIRFVSRLRTMVAGKVEVSPTLIFEQPTVRTIVAHLAQITGLNKVTEQESMVSSVMELAFDSMGLQDGAMRPIRIDNCLWCIEARTHSLLPLFATPAIVGTGDVFASLARPFGSVLYYLEHPTLHAGTHVEFEGLPSYYADAVRRECTSRSWSTFALIGTSFGGFLAHCIATAADADGFAPRKLILLDPPSLFSTTNVATQMTLRNAAVALLSVLLATAGEMGNREGEQQALLESLDAEFAASPEDETAMRATERLVQAGLRQSGVAAVVRTKRQINAFADGWNFMLANRSGHYAVVGPPTWEIFLMVAEDRVPFMTRSGNSAEEASVETARWYAGLTAPRCEMVCDAVGGGHFGETVSCAMGENLAFVVALRGFLEGAT